MSPEGIFGYNGGKNRVFNFLLPAGKKEVSAGLKIWL